MKYIIYTVICVFHANLLAGKEHTLFSPDKKIEVVISINATIEVAAHFQSAELFTIDDIGLDIEGKEPIYTAGKIRNTETTSINQKIYPAIREKKSEIDDQYNELTIRFKRGNAFVIRAYNEGIAYRFRTAFSDSVVVNQETFSLGLNERDSLYFQHSETFNSSYETPYQIKAIDQVAAEGYCCLPALIKKSNGVNVLIAESGLVDYPGLWIQGTGNNSLRSAHAGYPSAFNYEGSAYGFGQVKKHEEHIAKTTGNRSYPWRIFVVAENDADLISNTLVYQLAQPQEFEDVDWIKPGVVTFDWWGRRNIFGTGFKSGVNTETARYFIDFASDFGFEYFLFDDGWSDQGDLFDINPDLNMEEVLAYAKEKKVNIMLWAIWSTFEKQKVRAWEQFEKWGISGIKFDFMNRDDQKMVQFYHEVAREAAKRKMVIDFHGAYKPAGLRRMYPNVLTREALIEFEYNGWTDHDTPRHHNLLPYIRMATGPMDYIPYTTHNAQKKNFRPVGDKPMGMGTRAHSMALFVIMESPMQMLPDSPSDYYKEKECTRFISKIPVEWDDLRVLEARIGEYTALARRNGDDWFIGAITNWNPKEFTLNLDFLEEGDYEMEYVEDGINADTRAIDYLKRSKNVSKGDFENIKLAPGGGWIARITKKP